MSEPRAKRPKGPDVTSAVLEGVPDGDPRLESLTAVQKAKLRASYMAVDDHIQDGQVVGVGSGSTVVFMVQRLAERVSKEGIKVHCVPTSFQATQLITDASLPLCTLAQFPVIDVAIDGADELDAQLNAIKGGGGCQTQEKIVAANANRLVYVAETSKLSTFLGTKWTAGVPIEVVPLAYVPVMGHLKALGGEPKLRMAKAKAGPLVTDNGNFILDTHFGQLDASRPPAKLATDIKSIVGVVESGLFVDMATHAYLGMPTGQVTKMHRAE